MSRARSSMVLLGICVAALLIGALRLATERTPLPTASSYSTQPDGAQGLYTWMEDVGARPHRLLDPAVDADTSTLLIVQPQTTIERRTSDEYDAVPARGGTLVIAGDSLSWLVYARQLGIDVQVVSPVTSTVTTPDGLSLQFSGRYRLRAANAQALLVRPNGDVVAVRLPYKNGAIVAIASSDLLTNARLADPATARFVFRELVSRAIGQAVAFDEIHHGQAPVASGGATINSLLFSTPVGRAIIYAALLTFVYLLLAGRRLGPALALRPASESRRTMYEHVQMLANLYRRSGRLAVVRDAFARHYSRLLARGAGGPRRTALMSEALARVQSARTESDLIAAVAAVDDAR